MQDLKRSKSHLLRSKFTPLSPRNLGGSRTLKGAATIWPHRKGVGRIWSLDLSDEFLTAADEHQNNPNCSVCAFSFSANMSIFPYTPSWPGTMCKSSSLTLFIPSRTFGGVDFSNSSKERSSYILNSEPKWETSLRYSFSTPLVSGP